MPDQMPDVSLIIMNSTNEVIGSLNSICILAILPKVVVGLFTKIKTCYCHFEMNKIHIFQQVCILLVVYEISTIRKPTIIMFSITGSQISFFGFRSFCHNKMKK